MNIAVTTVSQVEGCEGAAPLTPFWPSQTTRPEASSQCLPGWVTS